MAKYKKGGKVKVGHMVRKTYKNREGGHDKLYFVVAAINKRQGGEKIVLHEIGVVRTGKTRFQAVHDPPARRLAYPEEFEAGEYTQVTAK